MISLFIAVILMAISRDWEQPARPRPVVIPPWSERDPDELWSLALRDIGHRMAPHYAAR